MKQESSIDYYFFFDEPEELDAPAFELFVVSLLWAGGVVCFVHV